MVVANHCTPYGNHVIHTGYSDSRSRFLTVSAGMYAGHYIKQESGAVCPLTISKIECLGSLAVLFQLCMKFGFCPEQLFSN